MARPLRLEVPGGSYHVWNRGVNRAAIAFDDRDRQHFFDLLGDTVRRFGWIVHLPVLMTNHYHLIITTPDPNLSRGMKWLQQKFVQYINRRYDRVGPLFQGRFKSGLVEGGSHLLTVLRYVALNPVQAQMVAHPEEYRWSGYRWLAGFKKPPAWFQPGEVLGSFGPDRETQLRELRKFVEAGADITRAPWRDAVGQILIGSEKWVESMRSLIEAKPRSNDHPAMQRYAARPRPAKIAEVVAAVFETTAEEIRRSHGTVERRVFAWLACYEGQARLGAIGTVLRLRSTSRVSELIAEVDGDVDRKEHRDLRIAIDRCLDLLRRERTSVAPAFREYYPSVSGPVAPF